MAGFLKKWFKKSQPSETTDLVAPAVEVAPAVSQEPAPIAESVTEVTEVQQGVSSINPEVTDVPAEGGKELQDTPTGLPVHPSFDEESRLILEHLNADNSTDKKNADPIVAPATSVVEDAAVKIETSQSGDAEGQASDVSETESAEPESSKSVLNRLRAGFGAKKDPNQVKKVKGFSIKRIMGLDSKDTGAVPIKVLIGYLPDVLERDVLEYAIGIAEKNFDQLAIVYYDVFKYDGGYVYEIHEGGSGKAFIPEILDYFDTTGEFDSATPVTVVIKTATRKVEVQKLRQGLVAVLLPESNKTPASDFINPKQDLTPAFNQRTGFFVISAAFFIVSFFAMVVAALSRYQPYEEIKVPAPSKLDISKLPSSQWRKIAENVENGKIVKAVKFKDGKWELTTADAAPAAPLETAPPAVDPSKQAPTPGSAPVVVPAPVIKK